MNKKTFEHGLVNHIMLDARVPGGLGLTGGDAQDGTGGKIRKLHIFHHTLALECRVHTFSFIVSELLT